MTLKRAALIYVGLVSAVLLFYALTWWAMRWTCNGRLANMKDTSDADFLKAMAPALQSVGAPSPEPPTHYILVEPWATYVEEAEFFAAQGGHTQEWGKRWKPVRAASIEDARALGKSPCKGFWNFCRCVDCMAKDRNLDKAISEGTPEQRRAALAQGMASAMMAKGFKP